MINRQCFNSNNEFKLECGRVLSNMSIAYTTYGKLSPKMDNIIWVCHALTANSDVDSWWPNTVVAGRFLDPERYFVICANILASPYGTTSPLSIDVETGEPFFDTFPVVTVKDMVKAHQLLARHLDIDGVKMIIGSSIGGFQAVEWIVAEPNFAKTAVLIATSAKTDPWAIAFNETQRMAIESDATFGIKSPEAARKGLSTARAIAMLSYRGQMAYDYTQQDENIDKINNYRASSYQRHQGNKLSSRFNAYSYYRLTQAIDSHDVGRGRSGLQKALNGVKARCTIVNISSDILFPLTGHTVMAEGIKNSTLHIIDSNFGHDGFLIESDKLNNIIMKHLNDE